jgi:hypothetical protein
VTTKLLGSKESRLSVRTRCHFDRLGEFAPFDDGLVYWERLQVQAGEQTEILRHFREQRLAQIVRGTKQRGRRESSLPAELEYIGRLLAITAVAVKAARHRDHVRRRGAHHLELTFGQCQARRAARNG